MSNYVNVTPELNQYIFDNSVNEPDSLAKLREQTCTLAESKMMTLPYQAQYLNFLLKLIQAEKVIEVGVFTGYATGWMALALPKTGQLIACDVEEKWANIGKPYWEALGVDELIDLRIGAAEATLHTLLESNQQESFDAVFIDADKGNYDAYYELSLSLLRKGGIILFDNLLWSGKVADPMEADNDTKSLREITLKLHQDARVNFVLLNIADGLGMAMKI